MKNILLIGAGQLGSRHLQALVKLRTPYNILVVDPLMSALALAKDRCTEIELGASHSITYMNALQDCELTHIHHAIIATSANYRFNAFVELIDKVSVEHIIFEKVLFQSPEHYASVAALLSKNRIKAWVNCPLRVFPFYNEMKANYFNGNQPIHYSYTGGEWAGLGCNSIHYIDHLNYFTQDFPVHINFSKLDKKLISSKRQGFVEFTGEFICKFSKGSTLNVKIIQGSDAPSLINLTQDDLRLSVEELTGAFELHRKESLIKTGVFETLYQSNLTNRYIEDIETTGACKLTPYADSTKLHLPFIKGLLSHYQAISQTKTEILPIT